MQAWVRVAKDKLVDPKTGLLVSSFKRDGQHLDGPEGSSIWMSAHALQLVDEGFAADQYARARRELGRVVWGFGYATEWPASRRGRIDVDSGPLVPGLDVSGGSSGLAFVAARAFGDDAFVKALVTTLDFAAFPTEDEHGLWYAASNQVGDAVMLYAMSLEPAWQEVQQRGRR